LSGERRWLILAVIARAKRDRSIREVRPKFSQAEMGKCRATPDHDEMPEAAQAMLTGR